MHIACLLNSENPIQTQTQTFMKHCWQRWGQSTAWKIQTIEQGRGRNGGDEGWWKIFVCQQDQECNILASFYITVLINYRKGQIALLQIRRSVFQNCFIQFLDSFQAFVHGKFQSHKFSPWWIFHVIGLTKILVAPSIVFCTKAMWAVLILFGFSLSIVFFLCCNFVVWGYVYIDSTCCQLIQLV